MSLERTGDAVRSAVTFLTPFGRSRAEPSPDTMAAFPLVGLGLGLAVGLVRRVAGRSFASLPGATVAVLADLGLTGALHLDGLADTADGLLAHVPTKSRLEIMAEPQVGSFGTAAVVTALIARTAGLDEVESPAFLAALWCASRSLMVLATRHLPNAHPGGLAAAFLPSEEEAGDPAEAAAIVGLAVSALLAATGGWRSMRALVAGCAAGALVLEGSRRRIGGYTGDVLGAAGLVCETVGLLAATRPGTIDRFAP